MRKLIYILALGLFTGCTTEESVDPCSTDRCFVVISIGRGVRNFNVTGRRTCNNDIITIEDVRAYDYEVGKTYCGGF